MVPMRQLTKHREWRCSNGRLPRYFYTASYELANIISELGDGDSLRTTIGVALCRNACSKIYKQIGGYLWDRRVLAPGFSACGERTQELLG